MLLMLLLLIPLAGIFLISTTLFHGNSVSNLNQIISFDWCKYTLRLINFILIFLAERMKYILNIRIIIKVDVILYCMIFYICYNLTSLIFQISLLSYWSEIYLLMLTSLFLIYMICYDKYLYNKYPKIYITVIVCCCAIIVYCILDLALKMYMDISLLDWVIYKFNQLKGFLLKINKYNTKSSESKGGDGGPSNQKKPDPNNKSNSEIDPEEAKKKRRKEANAKYRLKNKEKINQAERERYARNPEKTINRTSAWKKANPEKHRASSSKAFDKWIANHRDVSRANSKKWRDSNPEKVKATNDIFNSKRKLVTEQNRIDMAQYEGILQENKSTFESWAELSQEQLQDLFKKKRIRKDLQRGFEFFKENPNYYDDFNND